MARTVDHAKHEAKRRSILATATGLFARKGFDRTTTADICTNAGISSGSLFHYFPTKRSILHEIFLADGRDNAAALAAASTSDDPWSGIMRIVDLQIAGLADRSLAGLSIELVAQAGRDEALAAILLRNDTALRTGLTELLERAAEAGQIAPEISPDTAANWIIGMVDALHSRVAIDTGFDPAEQIPVLRLILTRFLRPQ